MSRTIKVEGKAKPSAQAYLTEKEGTYIKGILEKRFPSTEYPGQFSYLIKVSDTDARTALWNKETKTETDVSLQEGDTVFVRGTTMLNHALAQVEDGEKVEITFTGMGVRKPGRRAPYLFEVKAG